MGLPRSLVLWSVFLVVCHALPPSLDITDLKVTEPQCVEDLNTLRRGLQSGDLWAEDILDSGVRTPVGVFSQTAVQFGAFDECLRIVAPFPTQFCMLDVTPVRNSSSWSLIMWGTCLPASCKTRDLQPSLQEYMDSRTSQGEAVKVLVHPEFCTSNETVHTAMSTGDIIFCVMVILVVLIVTIATLLDALLMPKSDGLSSPRTFTQCFSARYSWHNLLREDKAPKGINLRPFYGLHLLAILFVIIGHRYGVHLFFMTVANYKGIQNMFANPWYAMWLSHMDLFVDVFFFMSSFILSVMYLTQLEKTYVSPLKVYCKRICRLIPAYVAVLLFYATLLSHVDDGPLWNIFMVGEKFNCENYWWTNILFVNNYVERDHICLPQSWYISCDFQLFLVGTLLVLLFHKNYHAGVVVSLVLFVASTLTAFFGTYWYDRPAMMVFNKEFWVNPRHNDMFSSVYTQAHYRGTTYLPGLLAGCYVTKQRIKPLSKKWTYALQGVGLLLFLVVFWSGALFYNESIQLSQLVVALYAAFFHSIFGLGLALMAISWTLGHSTPLSDILSWRGFIPLGKLTYCVYLVHFILPFVWIASARTPVYINTIEILSWTAGDLALSMAAACLLAITVEIPAKNLFTYCIITDSSSEKPATNESNVIET